jgi:Tripartite tricarboxylate transporter TctB family
MDPTASRSADRIGGLIWVMFGAAVVYGSWTMDRLESLGVPPLTAPGLVPGLLGLGCILFGLILLSRRGAPVAPAEHRSEGKPSGQPFEWRRTALSWALCVTYAGALLGRGPPYGLITAAFLFGHLVLLDESEQVPATPSRRRLVAAAIIAPVTAAAVTLIFQVLFLVRLP